MKDGTTVEVTTVSAADAGLTKAEKDASRVGMQLVPVLGSLPEGQSTAGITIARTRQIFSAVEDPKLGTNRRTADHEVLHAYALADHELQFQILDAIREAGLDSEFDALYNRAMNLWVGRYQEADPVTLQYQIEQEVMAEARAGNTNLLGRDVKKIGSTVRQTVRAWEKNWDTMSEELAEKYLAAKSDAERDAVMDEILQDIADQIPATWGDKFTAWRYLAMLGNLRTQIRNVVGNTAMQPLRITKETFSGLAEAILQRAGAKIDRTTSALYDLDTFKAAFQDYNDVRDVILSGGKYDDSRKYSAEIESKRRIFKNALLEGYRRATNTAMDVGDSIFCSFT